MWIVGGDHHGWIPPGTRRETCPHRRLDLQRVRVARPRRRGVHVTQGVGTLVLHTKIAIAAVVLLIIRFKIDPVISLIIGSIYLGLAGGVGFPGTAPSCCWSACCPPAPTTRGTSPFVTVFDAMGLHWIGSLIQGVLIVAAMCSLNSGLYTTGRVPSRPSHRSTAASWARPSGRSPWHSAGWRMWPPIPRPTTGCPEDVDAPRGDR